MQGIERAERMFWIMRDQIRGFGKARIIMRTSYQAPAITKTCKARTR
jgi:hypothetical protein